MPLCLAILRSSSITTIACSTVSSSTQLTRSAENRKRPIQVISTTIWSMFLTVLILLFHPGKRSQESTVKIPLTSSQSSTRASPADWSKSIKNLSRTLQPGTSCQLQTAPKNWPPYSTINMPLQSSHMKRSHLRRRNPKVSTYSRKDKWSDWSRKVSIQ